MNTFHKMSETEKEIMDRMWHQQEELTCKEMLNYFNDQLGRQWKVQTMSTFLARLVDKGLLGFETRKNTKYYYPQLSEAEYQQKEAKHILDQLYGGSVKNFVATLYGKDDGITKAELEELKGWFLER